MRIKRITTIILAWAILLCATACENPYVPPREAWRRQNIKELKKDLQRYDQYRQVYLQETVQTLEKREQRREADFKDRALRTLSLFH